MTEVKDNRTRIEKIADFFSGPTGQKRIVAIVAVVVVITLVAGGAIIASLYSGFDKVQRIKNIASEDLDTSPLEKAPVIYDLQKKYPDIVGWIYVPNTNVDYPIVQRPADDYYYMTHDATGKEDKMGAIFIESYNNPDLEDQINVIYGHNGVDNTMFTTLHFFENAEYFNKNDKVYIYTPNKMLTYRIISTFVYDDRHILTSYDWAYEKDFETYMYNIKNSGVASNVRTDMSDPTTKDKVIQLSTCMTNSSQTNERFLVNGVLVDEKEL